MGGPTVPIDHLTQDQKYRGCFWGVVLELKHSASCTLAKCSTVNLSPIQCRKILLRVWVLK